MLCFKDKTYEKIEEVPLIKLRNFNQKGFRPYKWEQGKMTDLSIEEVKKELDRRIQEVQ